MSEYRKQAAFLRLLLSYADSPHNRSLLERLDHAERNERCILSACLVVGLIALFGLAGLGYSAVLLPQFFHSSVHLLIRLFGALGLGSALCLLLFFGLWAYHRCAVNRLHEESRRVVSHMIEAHSRKPLIPFPGSIDDPQLKAFGKSVRAPEVVLRKAS